MQEILNYFLEKTEICLKKLTQETFLTMIFFLIPKQCIFLCVRLADINARIFSYHLVPLQGFELKSVELCQPETFRRMIHPLSYRRK